MYKQVLKTQNTDTIINYWKTQYYSHEKNIKEYFAREPNKLLIFDIEQDDIFKLKRFFNLRNIQLSTETMPHENISV